jgi:hypothetical protein
VSLCDVRDCEDGIELHLVTVQLRVDSTVIEVDVALCRDHNVALRDRLDGLDLEVI